VVVGQSIVVGEEGTNVVVEAAVLEDS